MWMNACTSAGTKLIYCVLLKLTRMWPMPNVMAALPNIGGALCSTPQSLANAHYLTVPCSNTAKMQNPLKFAGMPQTRQEISAVSRHPISDR